MSLSQQQAKTIQLLGQLERDELELLHLFNHNIGYKLAPKLARSLKQNSCLERLLLTGSGNIRTVGLVSICQSLRQMPASLRVLRLESTWNRNLDHDHKCESAVASVVSRHLQTLEWVDFANNRSSTELIAFNMKTSNHLTRISLANTDLGRDGFRYLGELLRQSSCAVRDLDVSCTNRVADDSMSAFIDSLGHNQSLEKLGLANCAVGDALVTEISVALRKTLNLNESIARTKLKHLDLSQNIIQLDGARNLFKILTKLANFRRHGSNLDVSLFLDLHDNPAMKDVTFACFGDEETPRDLSNVLEAFCEVQHPIGEGSFGKIFLVQDTRMRRLHAVKLEDDSCPKPQVQQEFKIYQILSETESEGFPRVMWGLDCGTRVLMSMELLGDSLEALFSMCGKKFSTKTLAMIGIQLVERLRSLHELGYIHRDLKPGNFVIGRYQTSNLLYLIDFGLAKRYRNTEGEHNPMKTGRSLTGTPRYSSINAHLGVEQSRRDDLEALGYMLVYFVRAGQLPWQGLTTGVSKNTRNKRIGEIKQSTTLVDLCKDCPDAIIHYLVYVRDLQYDETPDYNFLRNLFEKLLCDISAKDDSNFDWCPQPRKCVKTEEDAMDEESEEPGEPEEEPSMVNPAAPQPVAVASSASSSRTLTAPGPRGTPKEQKPATLQTAPPQAVVDPATDGAPVSDPALRHAVPTTQTALSRSPSQHMQLVSTAATAAGNMLAPTVNQPDLSTSPLQSSAITRASGALQSSQMFAVPAPPLPQNNFPSPVLRSTAARPQAMGTLASLAPIPVPATSLHQPGLAPSAASNAVMLSSSLPSLQRSTSNPHTPPRSALPLPIESLRSAAALPTQDTSPLVSTRAARRRDESTANTGGVVRHAPATHAQQHAHMQRFLHAHAHATEPASAMSVSSSVRAQVASQVPVRGANRHVMTQEQGEQAPCGEPLHFREPALHPSGAVSAEQKRELDRISRECETWKAKCLEYQRMLEAGQAVSSTHPLRAAPLDTRQPHNPLQHTASTSNLPISSSASSAPADRHTRRSPHNQAPGAHAQTDGARPPKRQRTAAVVATNSSAEVLENPDTSLANMLTDVCRESAPGKAGSSNMSAPSAA